MKADLILWLIFVLIIFFTSCKKKDDGIDVIDTNETSIELTVSNIKAQTGSIQIGLYNSKDNWDKDVDISGEQGGNELILEKVKVEGSKVEFNFEELDAGIYAFSIYHDENNNNTLDKIAGLLPDEPFGFSNNFKPEFGVPKFSDCSFEVIENNTTKVEVELTNN